MDSASLPEMTGSPFADGFGIRLRPPTADGAVEELRFEERLARTAGFESALRERAGRLANFRHACYASVRRVETIDGRLSLVSEVPAGARLSRILEVAERHHLVLDINAALCLIRQLVPAVAILHQNARDVSHGALSPERIVVTANAQAVVTEYVLGAAVEKLGSAREQLWADLRVATPADTVRPGSDHRVDVLQLGLVALALVLGRPLREGELGELPALLASATENSAYGKREPISEPLRRWLARALQLDRRASFESALEAQLALDNVLSDESGYIAAPIALETFLARFHECASAAPPAPVEPAASAAAGPASGDTKAATGDEPAPPREPRRTGPPHPARKKAPEPAATDTGPAAAPYVPRPHRARAVPALKGAPSEPAAPLEPHKPSLPPEPVAPPPAALESPSEPPGPEAAEPVVEPVAAETRLQPPVPAAAPTIVPRVPEAPTGDMRQRSTGVLFGTDEPAGNSGEQAPAPAGVHRRWRSVALALALVVSAESGFIFWKYRESLQVLPVTRGTLKVESNPPGAAVRVDGEDRGHTPLSLELPAGAHVLEVSAGGEPRVLPLTIEAGQTFSQYLELAGHAVAAGKVAVRSEPAGAAVLLNGEPRGTAPVDLSDVPEGEHELVLALDGARVRRTVTVAAGSVTRVAVPMTPGRQVPTSGWVEFRVPYEMQVFEGGRSVGTTSGRLPLTPGPHKLPVVSDTLAFRTSVQVNVAMGRVSRVPIALPRGVLHIDASPPADVWVDGEQVGQTPIGELAVPIGPHEILFRHPALGERRHAATVTAAEPVRVSVDLTKP